MNRYLIIILISISVLFGNTTNLIDYFEKNKEVMLIIDPTNGKIVKANRSASEFYGYSIEQLSNMKIQDINTLTKAQVEQEMQLAKKTKRNYFIFNHKLSNKEIKRVYVHSHPIVFNGKKVLFSNINTIERSEAVTHFNQRLEKQINIQIEQLEKSKDFISNMFISSFIVLLLIIIYLIYILNQRKKLADSLLEANKKFSLLYNNSPDMYVSVSPKDATIKLCNETFLKKTGYSKDEIIDHPIFKVYHEDCMDHVNEAFNEFIKKGYVKDKELILKKKDGGKIDVSLNVNAVKDENGKILYSMSSWRDITEHLKIEKELKDKDELLIAQSRHAAMGEMISMIAHQWRQPISVISMEVNNVLIDIDLEDLEIKELKEHLEKITYQTKELSKTIDDFKDFFKPDKKTEIISPVAIFENAYNVVGKSIENNDIVLETSFNINKKIETYSRELMQVLINIIKNAKEMIMERDIQKGIIKVLVEENKNSIIIKICDNAGGIDKTVMDKIFDPYFTTKQTQVGTGLGLYMSKTIIEKHLKGKIECFNDPSGACFKIELPYKLN